MSLIVDIKEMMLKRLKDDFIKEFGETKGLIVYDFITKGPLYAARSAEMLAEWDKCKTAEENMAKIMGDIMQDIMIDKIAGKSKNSLIMVGALFIEQMLDKIGISGGIVFEKIYNLSEDTFAYLNRRKNIAQIELERFNSMSNENKARATAIGKAPGLSGWNTHINEMLEQEKIKYENAIKNLAFYFQIPLSTLENFAQKQGFNANDLIKKNNLMLTRDEKYVIVSKDGKLTLPNGEFAVLPFVCDTKTNQQIKTQNSQNLSFSNSDKNDKFTNLQNVASNETASNSQNSQTSSHSEFSQENEETHMNSQNIRHSEPLIRHSKRCEESRKNSQTSHSQQTPQLQNTQTSRHSERSEESRKNLQTSQTSQNTPKGELSFTEKLLLKDFAYKLYGVKIPETKQRIGIDAATQHKISFLLGDISKHKRQIVRNFGEKTWQETFENFQKTNDLKVFENAVKSQNSTQNFNKNINLQISNENANLKNTNLQNSAGNVNSENNITNPQENGNDFKM